ncbi:MAG: FCD domain-containing protein, partial [Deltaproteobacteria bacterium]|nr:FCD domain-containing protein [Deltaproteobacteria bacterium]
ADFKEKFKAIALAEQTQRKGPKFHDALIEMANNEKLFNIYDTLSSNIRRYQTLSFNLLEKEGFETQKHVKEHLLIVEELMKGDFEAAKFRIIEHLDTLKNTLLEHIKFGD